MEKIVNDLAERNRRWIEEEGGIEGPTHLETLMQPEQQKRIEWLKLHCQSKSILDIGCNWGWVLSQVDGQCGVDINPNNIALARERFPERQFSVGDVTGGLGFSGGSFDTVIEADLLEHLDWFDGVEKALKEGIRIARGRLLVTLPWRRDNKCALCFKHHWLVTEDSISRIGMWLMAHCQSVSYDCDGNFIYLEALLRRTDV